MMSPERWRKIKSLFDAAMEIEASGRGAFLDNNCDGDAVLRGEVRRLIDSFENAESFIEKPAAAEVASLILEPSETLKNGQRFAHYEIQRQIGVGGMGEVYLAQDENLDRKVAIKILNEQFGRDESNLQRFVREAKAASALNHPNILIIHEIGMSGETNYIVSEFVEGETLRGVISKLHSHPDRVTTLSEILDIAIQIAGALSAAHGAHIVHRDIKPENIIVRPDGYVKILDFGLAKLVEQKAVGFEASTVKLNETAKGVILGTVNYMSPEQAKGEKVDERTDIFSFGILIYEMIAGRTPFIGDSMSETFANLINAEPQPLLRFVSNVPDELQRIVGKSLRKNKGERYQTMKGLLADLKDLRENLAFDERLEKSHSSGDKNPTTLLHATTVDGVNQTGEANQNTTGQTKSKRSFVFAVFGIAIICALGLGYFYFFSDNATSNPNVRKSLAVLPFINASQDPNADYLADGVTESIINNLSQLSGLRVMSRNSAFRFKDDQTDVKAIASKLGVETLVTGDIKQVGDKFVINVRLIDASDDSQIWGSQYVKTTADIIAAQNEIAQAVVQNLRVKLSNAEQQRLGKNYTENVEAWQLYQRGRFHTFKLTPPETNKGIGYFQQAIGLDPNYALAYAGLSDAYRSLAIGSEIDPAENFPKAIAAARKSIEIDDAISEGHTALAISLFWGEWNWTEAENQFKRALELNPNEVNAHLFYAHFLSNLGRHTDAITEVERAVELDPLFPFANALEGQFLNHAGRPDEALDQLQKTFELAPNFWMPHLFASSAYIDKGMYAEAIAEARKVRELSAAQTFSIALESYALAKSQKTNEAQNVLNELLKLSETRSIPATHIAMAYNGLGETDKALEWLEKGYAEHDPKMAFLKVEPKWSNLRNEPRFVNLMRRMNFE